MSDDYNVIAEALKQALGKALNYGTDDDVNQCRRAMRAIRVLKERNRTGRQTPLSDDYPAASYPDDGGVIVSRGR